MRNYLEILALLMFSHLNLFTNGQVVGKLAWESTKNYEKSLRVDFDDFFFGLVLFKKSTRKSST